MHFIPLYPWVLLHLHSVFWMCPWHLVQIDYSYWYAHLTTFYRIPQIMVYWVHAKVWWPFLLKECLLWNGRGMSVSIYIFFTCLLQIGRVINFQLGFKIIWFPPLLIIWMLESSIHDLYLFTCDPRDTKNYIDFMCLCYLI